MAEKVADAERVAADEAAMQGVLKAEPIIIIIMIISSSSSSTSTITITITRRSRDAGRPQGGWGARGSLGGSL